MITATLANNFLRDLLGFYATSGGGWYQTECYLGLSTTQPVKTESGYTVSEPASTAGYSRIIIRNNSGYWSGGSYYRFAASEDLMSMSNIDEIHFNTATAEWGSLLYVCLFSAQTGGTLLAYSALTTPLTVSVGYIPTIPVGGAVISITNTDA